MNRILVLIAFIILVIGNHFVCFSILNSNNIGATDTQYIGNYLSGQVENYFFVINFEGSGGHVSGGTLAKNAIVESMYEDQNIERDIVSQLYISQFPAGSFNDPAIYWGNYDDDPQIEIFYFDVFGTKFGGPFQINSDGSIAAEPNLWIKYITLPFRLPILILYFIEIIAVLFILFRRRK